MANIEPERLLVNFLRSNLTDINTSRTTNWIYDDFPQVRLDVNQYPRVSVVKIGESSEALGTFDDDFLDSVTFQIDIFSKKDEIYTVSVTSEDAGQISQNLSFDYVPTSVDNVEVGGGGPSLTVSFVNSDDDFGSPAVGVVEVSRSTGRMRFNPTDITNYSGTSIFLTYSYVLANDKAANYLAREIVNLMRTEWRNNRVALGGLFYPQIRENINQPYDELRNSFRRTITCQWGIINAGVEL